MGVRGNSRGLAWVILSAAFAGCMAEPGADVSEASGGSGIETISSLEANLTHATNVEKLLNATLGAEEFTMQDWFLMSMATGPDKPLAGFAWKVPSGGVNPTNWDASRSTVSLEIVPILPEGAANTITQIVIQAFRIDGGNANVLGQYSRGYWTEVYRTGPLEEKYNYPYVGVTGDWYWLGVDLLKPGDQVFFVLAVESEQPSELGMAFRVLNHDPVWDPEYPPKDFTAFQANVTGRPPKALERLGTGTGFSFPVYVDVRSLYAFGYEGWTRDAIFRDALAANPRPMVTARDLNMEFDYPTDRGWGYGVGGYYGLAAVGQWGLKATLHGTDKDLKGTILPGRLGSAIPDYGDGSGYIVMAEGDGPSHAKFHLTVTDTSEFDVIYFVHLDYAQTLDQLIGVPGKGDEARWGPAGERNATVAVVGPDLQLRPADGTTITLSGAGAGLQRSLDLGLRI